MFILLTGPWESSANFCARKIKGSPMASSTKNATTKTPQAKSEVVLAMGLFGRTRAAVNETGGMWERRMLPEVA